MSSIQISPELVSDIRSVLEKHDENAKEIGVGIQYLSALLGYVVAGFPSELDQKRQILQQLFQFSEHVLSENAAPAQTQAPSQEAYGVWKPENNS